MATISREVVSILNELDKLLRPSEVAKILGVSTESVRKLCESGKLRCVFPLGTRTRRIAYSALQKYLAEVPSNQDRSVEKLSIEQFRPKPKPIEKQDLPDVFARIQSMKCTN